MFESLEPVPFMRRHTKTFWNAVRFSSSASSQFVGHNACNSENRRIFALTRTLSLLPAMTHGGEYRSTMSSQKVYIINGPEQIATPNQKAGAAGTRATRTPNHETYAPHHIKNNGWPSAFRSYALGPISLVLWPAGKRRIAWAIGGAGSLLAITLSWIWWSGFFDVLEPLEHGALIWVASVTLVTLSVATTWARSVAISKPVCWPRLLRGSWAVGALGLVLPGFGLLIAGRRWKAAFAIWCVGLLVAAVVVMKHWRWLMANGISGEGHLTHQTIEWVLAVAAGCGVFGLLAWLALAFEGVRAVSPRAHSGSVANRLALALLVTLVFFLATFRPIPIARDLESAAARLEHHGMRIIPLAFCEVASMLDPGTPNHLARAATLYDELGLIETADAKRDLLQQRATQFASAVGAELVPGITHDTALPRAHRSLDTIDHVPPDYLLWIESINGEFKP